MDLRTRIIEALKLKLNAVCPEAISSLWDMQAVQFSFESLKFTPAKEAQENLQHIGSFEGVGNLHLMADGLDDLDLNGLIADFLDKPLTITPVKDLSPTEFTDDARLMLIDMRDNFTDMGSITMLRFNITGSLYKGIEAVSRPEYKVLEDVS